MTKPNVNGFLDYREYLKEMFAWKKATAPAFSYSVFATRAGFNAKSFLRLVITGKRNLTLDGAIKMASGFGLNRGETDVFTNLVQFNQAKDFMTRSLHWERIVKGRTHKDGRHQLADQYKFLARLTYPVLLVCLRQPHVSQDTRTLKRLTGLNDAGLKDAIETLLSLNAIAETSPGEYKVLSGGFHTGDDLPNIAAQSFHRNMLKAAIEKVELHTNEREFQSLMIPLNGEQLGYLKQRIRSIVDEIDQKFGGVSPTSEKVYAFNLNLVPLTESFIHSSNEAETQDRNGDEES